MGARVGRVRRLLPDPGPTSVEAQLEAYRPWEQARGGRPFVAMNFAATLDGRAAIGGVSGPIGSAADTRMLVGLRERFDAVLIGAGTLRAERYGRFGGDAAERRARERLGLLPAPLLAVVSGRLDLPWDAPLFAAGPADGEVVVFTAAEAEPPPLERPPRVVRQAGGIDLAAALATLRAEHGVRALLCEGGPRLHGELQAAHLADELFLTTAPKLAGAGPAILEGELPAVADLELAWLLEAGGELFARYRRR